MPVVVLRTRVDVGHEAGEAAFRAQQDARVSAERALVIAQNTIRDLQTKLAHMEMAHDETRAALRRVALQAEALERDLVGQTDARKKAENRLSREVVCRQAAEQRLRVVLGAAEPARSPPGKQPRGKDFPISHGAAARPATAKVRARAIAFPDDQEPVDWWSKHEKK